MNTLKKNPKCSHLLKATTGTPILPETANNGLDSSKTGREAQENDGYHMLDGW